MYKEIHVATQPVPPSFEMTTPLYVYNIVLSVYIVNIYFYMLQDLPISTTN